MNKDTTKHETIIDELSQPNQSSLKKYQDIFIGNQSFFSLLKYELITSLCVPFPGALGFFLRKLFFPKLFASSGRGAIFGRNVTLRSPKNIALGNNVFIDDNVTLDAKGSDSHIKLGDSTFIGKNAMLSCSSATINSGTNISIAPLCYIRASRGPITLGSFITMGAHTVIISGNPDYADLKTPMMMQEGDAKGIIIGDDVWFGVGVRIIDGVTIGNGSVIGAGALVINDIPDYAIAAGVPAKIIRSRKLPNKTKTLV